MTADATATATAKCTVANYLPSAAAAVHSAGQGQSRRKLRQECRELPRLGGDPAFDRSIPPVHDRTTVAIVFVGLGLAQFTGVASGGNDPFAPLAHLGAGTAHATEFRRVKSVAELDAILAAAPGKTVMLDFYADWCVSCKEMENFTFSDPRAQAAFGSMLPLQADVTANDEHDKAILKRFGLFGPPGIIFFDTAGTEIANTRVIGYQVTDMFLRSLAATRGR